MAHSHPSDGYAPFAFFGKRRFGLEHFFFDKLYLPEETVVSVIAAL